MVINKYLIVTPKFPRWSKTMPSGADLKFLNSLKDATIASNAIAIKVTLNLPDTLFVKPQLCATIKVDPSSVPPAEIQADVLDNIKEVLQQKTGLDINISMVENTKL